jgi:WD40 repeat protein
VLTTRSKVNSMQLSNDGRWAATAHEDGVMRLWNLSSANPSLITTRAIGSPATTVAFAPNTRWLAIGYRNGLTHLWSINNVGLAANAPSVFRGQTGEIAHITFSPNSSLVATTSADDSTYLWEVVTRLDPPSISVLRGHTARINDVVISPDNSKLITVSSDQTVRVWDLNASDPGRAWVELIGHDESVSAAAFSPDGRLLVTVSDDTSLRVWDTSVPPTTQESLPNDPRQLIQLACQVVGRNLTQTEIDDLGIELPLQPVCPSN